MECTGEGAAGGGVAGVLETVPDEKDGGRAEADSQAAATGNALEATAKEGTGAGASEGWEPSQVKQGLGIRGQGLGTRDQGIGAGRRWGDHVLARLLAKERTKAVRIG